FAAGMQVYSGDHVGKAHGSLRGKKKKEVVPSVPYLISA
ncbi:MAG: hypothetical protein RL275_295, partial [Chloroflexota bacterium]